MSYTQKAFFLEKGVSEKRVSVIWGPVNFPTDYIPPNKQPPYTVGYIGNASWWQGLPLLLDAARLLQDDARFQFRVAGFTAPISEQVALNVICLGRISRDHIAETLKACDILVSPRLQHAVSTLQYPQKLSEYLASGRPVIASDVNDQARIITEAQCGYVLPELSAECIAQTLLRFAELPFDAQQALGKRALAFAEQHFVPAAYTAQIARLYNSL